MITYINSENKQDYTVLFSKASAKLGLIPIEKEVDGEIKKYKLIQTNNGLEEVECTANDFDSEGNFLINGVISNGITSLNDYFQHIQELMAFATNIQGTRTGSDPYFMRLPADEPFFEINANTRQISVPSELSQVGVVGDKRAEILFFKIDRYFDAVDLNTRQIYIEWELPDHRKGYSRDVFRDVQSEKNKIIFGWVIDDTLTQMPGSIKFAVRFVEWYDFNDSASSGTSLEYSFSSLPANITISSALNYDLFENGDFIHTTTSSNTDIENFKFYLENSDPDITGDTAPELADTPKFVRNLDTTANLDANDQLELQVEATSDDAGLITYYFGYKANEEDGFSGQTTSTKYIAADLTKDTIFYKKAANDTYVVATATEIAEAEPNTLYEKVGYMIATNPGYYQVKARNNVSGKRSNTNNSNILYVPYAEVPVVSEEIDDHFVINEIVYEKEVNTNLDQSVHFTESNISYNAVAAIDQAASIDLAPVASPATQPSTNLTYQWYVATKEDMSDAQPIERATNRTYTASSAGYYAVKIKNNFNNDENETDFDAAGICRVTVMPEAPTIINWADFEARVTAGTGIPDILVEAPAEYDVVSYEWHKITDSPNDEDPIADNSFPADAPATGNLTFANEIVNGQQKSIAHIKFNPSETGNYYIILSNELNGATITVNTAEDGIIVVQ